MSLFFMGPARSPFSRGWPTRALLYFLPTRAAMPRPTGHRLRRARTLAGVRALLRRTSRRCPPYSTLCGTQRPLFSLSRRAGRRLLSPTLPFSFSRTTSPSARECARLRLFSDSLSELNERGAAEFTQKLESSPPWPLQR
jgi:hypothetical protein